MEELNVVKMVVEVRWTTKVKMNDYCYWLQIWTTILLEWETKIDTKTKGSSKKMKRLKDIGEIGDQHEDERILLLAFKDNEQLGFFDIDEEEVHRVLWLEVFIFVSVDIYFDFDLLNQDFDFVR